VPDQQCQPQQGNGLTSTMPHDRQACRKRRRPYGSIGARSRLTGGETMLGGFVVVVALIGFYVASLHFSPWVKCSNATASRGPVVGCLATHTRSAPKCDGTGHEVRFGRRLFRM
jgi:hypothetical protein